MPADRKPIAIVDDSGTVIMCGRDYGPGDKFYKAPPPMSYENRLVAYAAASKLRSLGYRWDNSTNEWKKTRDR